MISFFYETDFKINKAANWKRWIESAVKEEGFKIKEINYIFCDDEYLLQINIDYLQHDYYTDVIGFQYSEGSELSGDIYISIDRVRENAVDNKTLFEKELARVMIHGILHFMKYKDKTPEEAKKMSWAEDKYIAFFDELN